jgi:flagellar hook-basal body complex protein FliE
MQINSLESILSNFESISSKKKGGESESSFTDIFGEAINNVKETEAGLQAENYALLTGETDSIHSAMIAAQKAEIAVSLAVQIRNKVIESYNTVMGMQI